MRMVMLARRYRAFTLLETVVALVITATMSVSLLVLCPLGLREAETSLMETHGTLLARQLFTTLRCTPFTAADCFGETIDLSTVDADTPPLVFFAPEGEGAVTLSALPDSRYRITLSMQPFPQTPPEVEARQLTLTLTPVHTREPQASYHTVIVSAPRS